MPVDGSFFSVKNRPVGFEAAEMINAQRVQDFQLILDTFDPPGESVCLMNLPVVEWVAPKLSGGRKIIRGTPATASGYPVVSSWNKCLFAHTSALSIDTKSGISPMIRMPRSLAYVFKSFHSVKNKN